MYQSEERHPVEDNSTLEPVVPSSAVFLLDPRNCNFVSGDRRSWIKSRLFDKWTFLLTFAALCFLGMFAQGITEYLTYRHLSESSATTQGEVTGRRRDAMTGRTLAAKYFVSFRFTVPDKNISYTREQVVDKGTFENLIEGSRVIVRYLPTDPMVSTLVGLEQASAFNSTAYIMTILGLLGLIVTLVFLVPELIQLWKAAMLRRKGQLLTGHVLSCRRHVTATSTGFTPRKFGSALKRKFFVELTYRFRAPSGAEVKATAQMERTDLRNARLPGFGTPVKVLYLDDKRYEVL